MHTSRPSRRPPASLPTVRAVAARREAEVNRTGWERCRVEYTVSLPPGAYRRVRAAARKAGVRCRPYETLLRAALRQLGQRWFETLLAEMGAHGA